MTREQADAERPRGLRFVADVVNEVSGPSDWRRLAHEHGAADLAGRAFDADSVARAIERIRGVLGETELSRATVALSDLLGSHVSAVELATLADGRPALRPVLPDDADAAAVLLAVAAFALAEWVATRGRAAWGVCAAVACDRVFIDEGRRAPQRFCSPTCATRTRVASHRRRMANEPAAG